MIVQYLWAKLMKKLPSSAVQNCKIDKTSKINAQSTVLNSTVGRYSYCGYHCFINNCQIGHFCSIADNVSVGLGNHPTEWVSTSPAFHFGKGSIPKDLAALSYTASPAHTRIGSDVWIGKSVLIKSGVTIGTGAVIGMGSVVTKDVPPYAIVVGNPARIVKMRFSSDLVERLLGSQWWEAEPAKLKECAHLIHAPEKFLEALEG